MGTNLAGYTWLFDGTEIRYVLVRRSAISVGEFRAWFLGHTVVVPVLLILTCVVMWRASRGRGPSARAG